jgi:two-component system sensor histidine kinase DcuS
VVTDMRGIRYSHPNEALLGLHFIGDDLTRAGRQRERLGKPGRARRSASRLYPRLRQPARADRRGGGRYLPQKVEEQIARGRLNAVWTILFSIFMSSMAIWGLVRVLKRILFGLEPYEISALFEQRQAMLQSLREGAGRRYSRARDDDQPDRQRNIASPSGKQTENASAPCWPACVKSQRRASRARIRRSAVTGVYCCATWCPLKARIG